MSHFEYENMISLIYNSPQSRRCLMSEKISGRNSGGSAPGSRCAPPTLCYQSSVCGSLLFIRATCFLMAQYCESQITA